MSSLNRKIGVGVVWNLLGMMLSRGGSAIFTLFLARYLAPHSFGLIAMIGVFFMLANALVSSGMSQALIRRKELSQSDLSTVFLANLILSLLAYCLLYLFAPSISEFYNQQELVSIVRVSGLTIVINAFGVVQTAILTRDMNFRAQTAASAAGMLISGIIALLLADHGFGVWSLVVQMLVMSVVWVLILWVFSSWKPVWKFEWRSFRELYGYGYKLFIETIIDVLFQNSYILVLGRFFSAEITGLYYFARKITDLFAQQITGAVQQATFPVLSTMQDDGEKLVLKSRSVIQLLMFVVAPVMLVLIVLARPLFETFFDPQWYAGVPYLQLTCFVGLLYPVHAMNISMLNVKGRSDLVLYIGVFKKVVSISLLLAAIPHGIYVILLSQILGSLLSLLPNTYYTNRLIGYGLYDQFADLIRPILSALVAALLAWLLLRYVVADQSSMVQLVLCGVFAFIVYVIGSHLLRVEGYLILLGIYQQRNAQKKDSLG